MYVIFADRNSDWPPVQFVTEDKTVAEAMVEASLRERYEEHLRSANWNIVYTQERIDFEEFQISKGKTTRKQLNKERFGESYQKSLERYKKEAVLTFEQWKKLPHARSDWWYVEVQEINDLEAAIARFKEGKKYNRE